MSENLPEGFPVVDEPDKSAVYRAAVDNRGSGRDGVDSATVAWVWIDCIIIYAFIGWVMSKW